MRTELRKFGSVRFTSWIVPMLLFGLLAAQPGMAQNVRVFSGQEGRQDFDALLAAAGSSFALNFDALADQPIGWSGEIEIAQLPHEDLFWDGTAIPNCDQPGGIPVCPISEFYARASAEPSHPNAVSGGRLSLGVELATVASTLVMDFDGLPLYAWGGDFSAIGATGVALTVYYADPAAPNGWVKRALRYSDGTDAGPDGDGFFGFTSDLPILKIQLRPRFLNNSGFGTEQFFLDDVSGSTAPVPDPGPGSGTIEVFPASIAHTMGQGQSAGIQTFTVGNAGTGTLVYSVSENLFWLFLSPSACLAPSTCLAPPGPDSIDVNFDAAFLLPGSYAGTITVAAAGATPPSFDVPVQLTVVGPPTVSLVADPSAIALGQSGSLSWSASDADSCSAVGGWSASTATAGSQVVTPASSTFYTIGCTGLGGTTQRSALMTVVPPPGINFAANPPDIGLGGSSTLSWSSSDADACAAVGGWSGSTAASGSAGVSPSSSTTYEILCTGLGGTSQASASVTVIPAPTVNLTATPGTIAYGDSSLLSWIATDADTCAAVGSWSTADATSGSASISPSETTTYSISCAGPGGAALGSTQVIVLAGAAVPNDLCADATPIVSRPYLVSLDTVAATASAGDPATPCGLGLDGATVWYAYASDVGGVATLRTTGSDYDTVASVWLSGEGCGLLHTPVACNDDGVVPPQSELVFPVEANTSYVIQIGSRNGGVGGQLSVQFIPEPHPTLLAVASLAALIFVRGVRNWSPTRSRENWRSGRRAGLSQNS